MEYDARLARRAVLFCAVFPTVYFLHIAYSEAIFLLLSVGAFYHARRGQWLICGSFRHARYRRARARHCHRSTACSAATCNSGIFAGAKFGGT